MFSNYFQIALRNLRKNSTYALLNTLGLGLSIACSIMIFLLVRHHLSFDQFHSKIARTAIIGTESRLERIDKENNVPYPMGAALREDYAFIEKTTMVSARPNTLITIAQDGQAPVKFMEKQGRAFVEPEFFDIFDFPLVRGSLAEFTQPNTALLTETLARKYYGQTDAIGKTFKIHNRLEYRVIGVLKDLPDNTDLKYTMFTSWATIMADSNSRRMLNNWGGIHGGTQCFVTFREGHDVSALEAAFPAFRDKHFHPEVREWWYHAIPLKTAHFDTDYGFGAPKKLIWSLALIGVFLLFTACINFVNMATAQALSRAKEVGVRKTMGSTRAQLFWQFMAETGVIVLFSMGIGLLLAQLSLPWLNQLAGTSIRMHFTQDLMLYAYLGLLTILLTFLSGAYPGLSLSGFQAAASLKGSIDQRKAGGFSLRRLLVGTQFAISQALIIAAVVITSQMEYTRHADLGFRREGIVNVGIPSPDAAKKTALKQQLSAIAGVENLSLCMQPPASDANWNTMIKLQNKAEPEPWNVNLKFVDTKYLETFDMQLLAGRNLQVSDTSREYLVNEEIVKKLGFSSPEEIVGKMLDVDHNIFPVVGVVKNFHNRSFHEKIAPQVLTSQTENYDVCALRINLQNARPTLEAIEKTWTSLYPEYYYEYGFMDEQIAAFYEKESVILKLSRSFAGMAIFIGCLGLYGLAAFMIARKNKEIGIRKVLGAHVGGILWLFGKEYTRLILFAFAVAAPLGWWAMNTWLNDFNYRISMGWGIFLISLVTTFGIAVLTVGFQSVRAAWTNPVQSLRSE